MRAADNAEAKLILVGDVGGTRTRLALARQANGAWVLSQPEETPTTPEFVARVVRFLGGRNVEAAAFGIAGPVTTERSVRLTNADVRLDVAEIAGACGIAEADVTFANDFRAIAEGLPYLPREFLQQWGGGDAVAGQPVVVLGAGTGLGASIGAPGDGGWRVVQGEGGHADLAPVDDEELETWQRLRRAHGRVSAETVLSGPGLERLYAAIAGRNLDAAGIDAAAWRGEPEAARAHALFTRWLGRVAGNLVLTAGARGGVYLAGGILPRWSSRFDVAAFRRAFEDKGQYAGWLRATPSFLITHPNPGLLGLAVLASARR
jgi:glucokinase